MNIGKSFGIVFMFLVLLGSSHAQVSDLTLRDGVAKHAAIDRIYTDFSRSYRTLDVELLAGLYTADASYLPPNQETMFGIKAIKENFADFFDSMKQSGRTLTIKFDISKRRTEDKIGYDVGKFEIVYSRDGGTVGTSTGKFVVVTVKDKGGKWRFAVDSYSALAPASTD